MLILAPPSLGNNLGANRAASVTVDSGFCVFYRTPAIDCVGELTVGRLSASKSLCKITLSF